MTDFTTSQNRDASISTLITETLSNSRTSPASKHSRRLLMTTTSSTFAGRITTEGSLEDQRKARISTFSSSSCQIQSSRSTCIPLSRIKLTQIVPSFPNSFRAKLSKNTTTEFILTFWDKLMRNLEEIYGDWASDQRFPRRPCLSELMSATKANRALSDSVPLMTSTCASIILRQVLKVRKDRRSSVRECSKNISRALSRHSATTTKANYQITSSSIEMV